MNWLFSFLYYVFIVFQYIVVGKTIVAFAKLKEKISYYLITGFFFTYAITFLVAFPSQLLHFSWNAYFILQLLVFLFIDIFCLLINKSYWQSFFDDKKLNFKSIRLFLSENWLLVLFVIMFTVFSMSNQLQFYEMNYDDYYYIGKMVNLVDAPQLFNENYFNGSLEVGETIGISRLFNSYEISYSFFATLFHIHIPFFCRVTMVLHNYVIFAIVYKELGNRFVKAKHAQYTLLPFFIFLIPGGWLYHGINLHFMDTTFYIRSYDLWQFQTAVFYGGSIVRMMALPVLYLYSEPLINKMDFKQFIVVGIISLSLLSFSSIFAQILILFLIAILFIKFLYHGINAIKIHNRRLAFLYILASLFIILLVLGTKIVDNFSFFDLESYLKGLNEYLPFIDVWFKPDLILNIGWIFVLLCVGLNRNISSSFWAIVLLLFIIFRSMYFPELVMTTAFNYFFVPLRTISSIQYLFLFSMGVSFIRLCSYVFRKNLFYNLTSIFSVLCVIVYFITHYNVIIYQNFLGSGISLSGWDFNRVLDINTEMMPTIFVEVGDFFNQLPYGNYNLYTPKIFKYEEHITHGAGFVMASNRIVTHVSDGMKMEQSEIDILDYFCNEGVQNFDDVIEIIKDRNIDYIIVFNNESMGILKQYGYSIVLESSATLTQDYYMFKVS